MKEHTIHIRVSDRDLKQLDDTAERLGLSRSDLLRRCLSLGLVAFENVRLPDRQEAEHG